MLIPLRGRQRKQRRGKKGKGEKRGRRREENGKYSGGKEGKRKRPAITVLEEVEKEKKGTVLACD